jgi:predicted ATPase
MAVAQGGQVLLTEPARGALGTSADVRDLGHHRLKDLPNPERLFQLLAPSLQAEFPPLRSLNRSNLPAPATPFVGRSVEVSDALARLGAPDVRLLTVLGPGGAGKTRLAVEVAGDAVGRYRDGVWLVLLAPLTEPGLMMSEIARALEIDALPGQPLEQAVAGGVAERELLLVLDNAEHLLEAAAGVVADILAAAPRVDVLVTSREPLRITGEHRFEVPPMPPPEAVELFVQRAHAVRPDLELEQEETSAIERICARLDGLPLALELAAARVSVLRPRALEARLAEGLPLPSGSRDLPERQRTLRATIDWSYRLLEAPEQALLASLSPFVGGVRLDTAERLWGPDGIEGLFSLAEKSLLRRREDADGEVRFWMLEMIRQYAVEIAENDARARHAHCYYELTEEARPNLIGPHQREWLDRLERDHPNHRAALEHLTEHEPDAALRMASTLTWLWDMRGYNTEARRRLSAALMRAPPDSPNRGDALHCAGWMAWVQGDAEAAQLLLGEALPLLTPQGPTRMLTEVYTHLGIVAEMLRDEEGAMALHEQAIATARAAEDDWALGVALNNYAIVRSLRPDRKRFNLLLEEALTVLRPTGDAYMISIAVANLAEGAVQAGDLEHAEQLNDEALALSRQIDFRPHIAGTLELAAFIALERGDVETAAESMREALDIGLPFQSESIAARLTLAAAMAAIRRQPIRAATLWGAAEQLYEHVGVDDRPIHSKLRARWEPQAMASAPNQATWDAGWKIGGQLTMQDALALAADWRDDDLDAPEQAVSLAPS